MYPKNHTYPSNSRLIVFILLCKKVGKRKEPNGVEKECYVSPGSLAEPLVDSFSSKGQYLLTFRTYDSYGASTSEINILCRLGEVEPLDEETYNLLLPILSLKERLNVYRDKHLLNDGKRLQPEDGIFVRLKDSQSEVQGKIRHKGQLDGLPGTNFGVELAENRGVCDGAHSGMRYFQTAPNHAVFVSLNRIRRNREDWQRHDLQRAGDLETMDGLHIEDNSRAAGSSRGASIGAATSLQEYGDLKIGDRIVWYSDDGKELGTVRWIGVLPGDGKDNVTVGVEFDNPVGTGTGKYKEQRLFYTAQGHASLIPPMGLYKENMFERPNTIFSEQEKLLNDVQKNRSLSQQTYGEAKRKSKVDVHTSSLPAQFNQYSRYLEPASGVNGVSPTMSEQEVYSQGRGQGVSYRQASGPPLVEGTLVEIPLKPPVYGVIRWIGSAENSQNKLMAGVELENDHQIGTDGVFKNTRYFYCKPNRALFVPLTKCHRDRRFQTPEQEGGAVGGMSSPEVSGDIPIPEIHTDHDLRQVIGKHRGIQGHHNSCYLDSTLFCMFYFSTVFDSIFNRPPKENDLPEYTEVQRVLKDGIVNPLRKNKYVASNNVWKLRVLLDKLGTVPGMMGEEKDVEEFLSALLSQIMKADPLLHLSTGEHAYFYQLFMEKDENLLLPTTQKLVELSFLQGNVKLKEVPACLMIQMPRFGKDYKMFRRIVPSLQLDITDILENSPRDCIVCGDLATWECKKCYQVHGLGLNTTAFCDKCKNKSHQHASRKNHQPERILTDSYLSYFQELKEEQRRESGVDPSSDIIVPLPREKMELFAVVCIQTSHYVSFVKCGPGVDAPWVFFDSMADRIGEQGGYNVPEVVPIPEMANWLSENNLNFLNKDEDKELPEHLRRLLCDGYMCMYQSPDVMMFQ